MFSAPCLVSAPAGLLTSIFPPCLLGTGQKGLLSLGNGSLTLPGLGVGGEWFTIPWCQTVAGYNMQQAGTAAAIPFSACAEQSSLNRACIPDQ